MLTRIPIRSKLALALVLPVLAVFAVSIYEVGEAGRTVDKVREDTDLASVALGPGALITALQNERNDTATTLVGLRATLDLATKDLAATQQVTDTAADSFRAALARSGPEAEQVYAASVKQLDTALVDLRQRTEDIDLPQVLDSKQTKLSNEQFDGYSGVIDQFLDANSRLSLLIEDPELRSATQMLDALSRQFDSLAVMVRTGAFSKLDGAGTEGLRLNDVLASITKLEGDTARIDLLATGSYAEDARAFDENPAYAKAAGLLKTYVNTSDLEITALIETAGDTGEGNVVTTETLTADTASALESRSNRLLDDAEGRQRNFIALALMVLFVGGAFMVIAARSITRPLLSLTKQADDMAAQRLPSAVQQILDTPLGEDVVIPDVTPVEVQTRDEVQDVAVALNSVQRSALNLAVEQAVLRRNIADSFVNLGRRTQNLIGRQLDFITELERNETDPATLNNLFKLDHLATRARRNAESLVVLAGLVTPRTWAAPIAMADVIRAALGEVEDYQRVEIRPIGDALVPGRTASDLVHLLAELLENGLSFSPPGRPVEVHGRMTKNGYVLAIIDQGIGMTKDELESANERLAGRESYTVAPSRYLGHYVAGNLAQRIGVEVSLAESPTGGVAAKVVIPKAVLDAVPAMPGLPPPAQGELAADSSNGSDEPVATTQDSAGSDIWVAEGASAEPSSVTVPATGREGAGPTTEHGLRRRVRRPAPDGDPTTGDPGGPVRSEPSLDPASASASVDAPPLATASASDTARVSATASAPDASASATVAASPVVPAPAAEEEPAMSPSAATPAPSEAEARLAPVSKTANGLRKRIPGDQLAASSLAPSIPRGRTAAPVMEGAASAEPAPADSMFSLLSTFESGVQRGRTDITRGTSTDAPASEPDREV